MTLSEKVAGRHLAVPANLLALGLQLLLAALPLHAQLIAVRLAGIDPLDAIRLNALTLDDPLLLDAIVTDLAPIGSPGLDPFGALRPGLLTLDMLRPRLLALGDAGLAFDALRTCLLTLDALLLTLRALRTFTLSELLTLRALRRTLRALFDALRPLFTAFCLGLLAVAAITLRFRLPALVGPRIRRGCDRQRGYAGREKDPGHKFSPSNGKNGPSAAPFQRLNGWNLHPTALA
jgi:hypothetical protein